MKYTFLYVTRNDNYCGDSPLRFKTSLLNLVSQLSKFEYLKKHVEIVVKESNVNAQLFFKSMGFTVVETIRNKFTTYHDDLPSVPYIEDGLLFRFGK